MRQALTRVTLAAGLVLCGAAAVPAADLSVVPESGGLDCDSAAVSAFPSVWLGHFSGGIARYPGPGQAVALDWRDEKLCFPSGRDCGRYIRTMRRAFHRPEGYFTCLPIR